MRSPLCLRSSKGGRSRTAILGDALYTRRAPKRANWEVDLFLLLMGTRTQTGVEPQTQATHMVSTPMASASTPNVP